MKTKRSERSGWMYSLKTSFRPSARVCMMPQGPALFGPMRFWKPAITLRSNQIIKMTAMSMTTKATTTLMRTMMTSRRPTPMITNGSRAST